MRSQHDVELSEKHFEDLVWYSRHRLRLEAINSGHIALVDKDMGSGDAANVILKEVWLAACEAATTIEADQQGKLGPWSDYEWGKINGKLSALRWLLGLPWDMLDT
jgi:hypothetical protein